MKYTDFIKKKVPLSSIYLVVGKEEFFRQEVIHRIQEVLQKEKGQEPFIMEFDDSAGSGKVSSGDILDELKTPSMFYPHKIVVVREAKKFMEEYGQTLLDYLKKPAAFSTLILETSSFDGRLKLSKSIAEKGETIQCEKLYDKPPPWQPHKPVYDSDLCKWIVNRIKERGKSVSPQDAYIFIERLGGEVGKIAPAIDSLMAFTEGKKKITGEQICNLLGISKRSTSFEFQDCLVQRDLRGALAALEDMFREGLPDVRGEGVMAPSVIGTILVATLYRKFRQIWEGLTYHSQGLSFDEIASRLKINKFLFNKFREELKAFQKDRMPFVLKALFEVERQIKSTSRPPREILEELAIKICGRDRIKL